MDERRADLLADLLSGRETNPDLVLPTPVNPGKTLLQVVMPMTALLGHETKPAGFGPDSEQDLGDGEREQFGVGRLRGSPWSGAPPKLVIDLHMECGWEGVEVGRHKLTFNTLLPRLG
jgi:hypothetical protein